MRISIGSRKKTLALTLVEVLVTTVIVGIVGVAIGSFSLYSMRSFVAMGNYADLDRASRKALDVLSREIRQTRALTNFTTTSLSFLDYDGLPLVFSYNPTARTLTRSKGNNQNVLLEQCDFLKFNVSQRNPSNSFDFYPTTNVRVVKLIDMSWRCSRQILGAKVNTESVQTAKIVIRN